MSLTGSGKGTVLPPLPPGRARLADQIDAAAVARVTFDDAANAGYIYVHPSRELNVVETNIMGVRHGETLEVETPYWTNIGFLVWK